MNFLDTQAVAELYMRRTENEIRQALFELRKHIKKGGFFIQTMHNQKIFDHPSTFENWSFQSRIVTLLEYDFPKETVLDAKGKRKDKSLLPISHDPKTIEINKKRFFTAGVDDEFTENYIEDGGENVETMFGQFWLNVYHKTGFTIACEQSPDFSLRGVIMLDKEAFDSIEGSRTQKINLLRGIATKLINNLEGAVVAGRCLTN